MISTVLEAIGLRQARQEKKAIAAEDLTRRLAIGDADLTPEEVDTEADRLGVELEDLDFNIGATKRIAVLEEIEAEIPRLKAERDRASEAVGERKRREPIEREEFTAAQIRKRGEVRSVFDAADAAYQSALAAQEELRELRRCWPAGPVSSKKRREVEAANVMSGRLIQVQRESGKFEMWDEEARLHALPMSRLGVSIDNLHGGATLRYTLRPDADGNLLPFVIGFEPAPPVFRRPVEPDALVDAETAVAG